MARRRSKSGLDSERERRQRQLARQQPENAKDAFVDPLKVANARRATNAARQAAAEAAETLRGLPSGSVDYAVLRLRADNPDLSLAELAALCVPPMTKDAYYSQLGRALKRPRPGLWLHDDPVDLDAQLEADEPGPKPQLVPELVPAPVAAAEAALKRLPPGSPHRIPLQLRVDYPYLTHRELGAKCVPPVVGGTFGRRLQEAQRLGAPEPEPDGERVAPLAAKPSEAKSARRQAATAAAFSALFNDSDTEWQDRALCAETDPESFFPEKGGSTREAKKICQGCDVRSECLDYALARDERFGIWGGLSERERRRFKRDWAAERGLRLAAELPPPTRPGPESTLAQPARQVQLPTTAPVTVRHQQPISIRYLGRASGKGALSVRLRRIGGIPEPVPEPMSELMPEPPKRATRRRGHDTGTVYQTKEGCWSALIDIRRGGRRFNRRKVAKSREEAEVKLAELETAYRAWAIQ